MVGAQSALLPPSDGNFVPLTPSCLTPNAHSEAEAALRHNSTAQTDSAAPGLKIGPYFGTSKDVEPGAGEDGTTEAPKAYWR